MLHKIAGNAEIWELNANFIFFQKKKIEAFVGV
jgi:hypothetical protein